ncbi:hypothetical protein ELQ90_03880 [Labedella phragmitis]|uniref:Peptide chain release factor 1 n=1 Tax=Labedella phragmitis TaxID=2498849 RepID=A0A444PZ38_9MICO|nr:Vms1/Ankzf1 family peptidyl-tRNA hydrolase [Labedella phragmitis]RWZ53073.1 hypothetical protein ELQ90_03880 [Labedella phragmitis]
MTDTTDTVGGSDLAGLLRSTEPVSVVYTDASGDQENPGRFAELRARGIAARLEDHGAPHADIEAVEDLLSRTTGAPSPVSRFLVVRGGEVLVDEVLAGEPVVPERVAYGPVPDITPLVRHRPADIAFVVAEVQRDSATISLRRTARVGAVSEDRLEGREDAVHKFGGGGWSHLRYQRHSEEVWRQNEAEVAEHIEKLVAEHAPAFVIVGGDVRAVQKLEGELTEPSASLTTTVVANIAPEGSSDDVLESEIDRLIGEHVERDLAAALDLLRAGGPGSRTSATGVGEVVAALQQSQVEILILGAPSGTDSTVLALDGAPWVATAPEETFGAAVLARAPTDLGLTRAALLTDARVLVLTDDDRPRDDDRLRAESYAAEGADPDVDAARPSDVRTPAAVLRWATGPDTPA